MYWDKSNVCGWVMMQKMQVDGLKRRKDKIIFNKEFIENYDENSYEGYILEVQVKYL